MKRLFALLLVVIMVLSLVACQKPVEKPDDTTGNTTAGTTVNEKPFKGKTLQLWGFGAEADYTDYSKDATTGKYTKFGNNYLWMMKAAIEEWAAINEVKIQYYGDYNKDQLLAAQGSGAKPDLVFAGNEFPSIANLGIAAQFTDEEYNKIAEVADSRFLDMYDWRGGSWGIVVPWTGNEMVYYNKTMFEKAGVKSPGDYFAEGNWTWETLGKCIDAVTKDTNDDGKYDIYGMCLNSFLSQSPNPTVDPATGKLTIDVVNEAYTYDFAEFCYQYTHVKKTMYNGGGSALAQAADVGMSISDCENYNWKHQFRSLNNGDEIRVVPAPKYEGKTDIKYGHFTQSGINMLAGCDEREATVDLICYLLQAGIKYMSDISDGLLTTTYKGITGACELSKKWVEAFNADLAARDKALEDVTDYDKDFMKSVIDWYYADDCTWICDQYYAGCGEVYSSMDISVPPATCIEELRDTWGNLVKRFNDNYIYD